MSVVLSVLINSCPVKCAAQFIASGLDVMAQPTLFWPYWVVKETKYKVVTGLQS